MSKLFGGIALITATMLNCKVALGQNTDHSATAMMPACRDLAAFTSKHSGLFEKGLCAGMLEVLAFIDKDVCQPMGVTDVQAAQVVVQYIENRPERQHESFKVIALEALRAGWPCKR